MEKLSVLDWARERLANTHRLAGGKDGADRAGWLEDAWYWQEIVNALESVLTPSRRRRPRRKH